MSSIDLTEALARLLSDTRLRALYRTDSRRAACALAVSAADLPGLLSLDPDDLDRQAEGLISKRFYEVSLLLPHTLRELGEPGRQLFRNYADRFWPAGHQRHLIDAYQFCRYLQTREGATRAVYRSEFNRVRFLVSQGRCAIHLVSDLVVRGKRRRAIQFFYRRRKCAHWCVWTLGW